MTDDEHEDSQQSSSNLTELNYTEIEDEGVTYTNATSNATNHIGTIV